MGLVLMSVAGMCLCAGTARPTVPPAERLGEYAFFEQWTLASHKNGSRNNWPCMARLSDSRILVVWSTVVNGNYTVVAAFSSDSGCSWTRRLRLISNTGLVDADPSIVVSGDRVFVTCTTVKPDGINTSTTWCVRSDDNGESWSDPYTIPMNRRQR